MAYTHIQHIAYQVPTVAKVYNTTVPTPNPAIPTGAGAPFPSSQVTSYLNGNIFNTFDTYYNDNGTYRLYEPPSSDPDLSAWRLVMATYMHALMQYLENRSANNLSIPQAGRDMIKYLKHHTYWHDWTIPSGGPYDAAVEIFKVPNRNHEYDDAYTLGGFNLVGNTHLNLLNQAENIDAKNRVIRFLNVLYRATLDKHIDNSQSILKVFTAPEFYFRPEDPIDPNYPEGNYRAYTKAVFKAIKAVLEDTISSMSVLSNWLVIPGTIMWYMPKGIQAGNNLLNINVYFNSCTYMWHNNDDSTNSSNYGIQKAKISRYDGVPWGHDYDYGGNAPTVFPAYWDDAHLNRHMFTIDGVETGLEICIEHTFVKVNNGQNLINPEYHGILAKQIRYDRRSAYHGLYRHLQLLIAGGAKTNIDSIALRNKGVFLRNDGVLIETVNLALENGNIDIDRYVDVRKNTFLSNDSPTNLAAVSGTGFPLNYKDEEKDYLMIQSPEIGTDQLDINLSIIPFDQQKIAIFLTQEI